MAKEETKNEKREDFEGSLDDDDLSTGTPWKLMLFTLVLFVFSVVLYLGVVFGYKPYVQAQIKEVESNMKKLSKNVSEGQKKEFLNFYSQLTHLKSVLDSRKYMHNIFKILEENTISSVYFNEARASMNNFSLQISGTAKSLKSVVDQVAIFEKSPGIEGVVLEELSLDESSNKKVDFDFNLSLNPSYLEKKAQ